MRRRPRDRRDAPRACLTAGCSTMIAHWKLLCDDCLKSLPWQRRRALLDAPRHLKFVEAQSAAAFLAEQEVRRAASAAAATARVMGERDG